VCLCVCVSVPHTYLCEGEVDAAAVTLVAEVVCVGVDAQEADQTVQLSNTVLRGRGRTEEGDQGGGASRTSWVCVCACVYVCVFGGGGPVWH